VGQGDRDIEGGRGNAHPSEASCRRKGAAGASSLAVCGPEHEAQHSPARERENDPTSVRNSEESACQHRSSSSQPLEPDLQTFGPIRSPECDSRLIGDVQHQGIRGARADFIARGIQAARNLLAFLGNLPLR
jgi:hypothetical protein